MKIKTCSYKYGVLLPISGPKHGTPSRATFVACDHSFFLGSIEQSTEQCRHLLRFFFLQSLNTCLEQAFDSIHIVAPDASARAAFIPFGATTTNFWVKDKVCLFLHCSSVYRKLTLSQQHGVFRDILLGFDDHVCLQLVSFINPSCILRGTIAFRRCIRVMLRDIPTLVLSLEGRFGSYS